MKKIIVLLLMIVPLMTIQAQSISKVETLKTTDLGNQKLQVADSVFCILLKTGNQFQKYIPVGLGRKNEALKLLQFMLDANMKGKDVLTMDNPTNNTAKWGGASGYIIFSDGGILKGRLRKQNIRAFIEEIEKY